MSILGVEYADIEIPQLRKRITIHSNGSMTVGQSDGQEIRFDRHELHHFLHVLSSSGILVIKHNL